MEQQIQSYQARIGMSMSKHLQHIEARRPEIPDYYLLPDQVLLLNFNYTKMADLYLPEGSAFQVNHIHGELENEYNPSVIWKRTTTAACCRSSIRRRIKSTSWGTPAAIRTARCSTPCSNTATAFRSSRIIT